AAEILSKQRKRIPIELLPALFENSDADMREAAIKILQEQEERSPITPPLPIHPFELIIALLPFKNEDVCIVTTFLMQSDYNIVLDFIPQTVAALKGEVVGTVFMPLTQMFV